MERINEKEAAERIVKDINNGYYESRSVQASRTNFGNTEPVTPNKQDITKTLAYIAKNTDLVKSSYGSYYVDPQSCEGPIREGETLEPCVRGGQKILSDPKQKKMMREIFRGI